MRRNTAMTSIEQIKQDNPDMWVLVKVTRVEKGAAAGGVLLSRSPDRSSIYRSENDFRKKLPKDAVLYSFFTGDVVPKGFSVAL